MCGGIGRSDGRKLFNGHVSGSPPEAAAVTSIVTRPSDHPPPGAVSRPAAESSARAGPTPTPRPCYRHRRGRSAGRPYRLDEQGGPAHHATDLPPPGRLTDAAPCALRSGPVQPHDSVVKSQPRVPPIVEGRCTAVPDDKGWARSVTKMCDSDFELSPFFPRPEPLPGVVGPLVHVLHVLQVLGLLPRVVGPLVHRLLIWFQLQQ